jgi:peptide-methionine (S)-S-oxide reductase
MHPQWRLAHRAVLAAILLTHAAVAQDRAASGSDQGQSGDNSVAKKSPAAKSRRRKTTSANRPPAAETTPSGAENSSSSPEIRSAKAANSSSTSTKSSSAAAARKTELATFGAGCFWHVEDIFEQQKGVLSAVSGYSGGNVPYPTYEMVHTGETGHAECVQVEYDPSVISYEKLLKIFWSSHDPTSINRQGEDEGPQYRSVIFYHSEAQRKAALESYERLTRARAFRLPIVTQLVPMQAFFRAEDYHQNYYSGMRRSAPRRRKPSSSRTKVMQRKPTNPGQRSQSSRAAAASPKPGPPAALSKSEHARDDQRASSGARESDAPR